MQKRTVRAAVLSAAVASVALAPAQIAFGDVTGGLGREYIVSTSGATALSNFTRGNSDSSGALGGGLQNYRRGTLALGGSAFAVPTPNNVLVIGQSTYSNPVGAGQFLGIANKSSPLTNEPPLTADRLVYYYGEVGSSQGVLNLVDSNGLLIGAPARRPADPASNRPSWINGNRFNGPDTQAVGGGNSGYVMGRNYQDAPNQNLPPVTGQTGQPFVRIAWTDVRSEQSFAVDGARNVAARPTAAGYGRGPGGLGGGTDFQALRNESAVLGGVNPATTRLRNESLAAVPFNIVANPGTGLARLTKAEAAFLSVAGRLPNGANFNAVTRDIGSGTRNQGGNNLGVDPSWTMGERDRIALATFNTLDVNGDPVTVLPGQEADPRLSLTGSTVADPNESRVSPTMRFADKTSGSQGVRQSVRASRMGIGTHLSQGDSQDALHANRATPNAFRALALSFEGDPLNPANYYQATARNVTEGQYKYWSASQAVTVAPYVNPEENDLLPANLHKPISGDINDQANDLPPDQQPFNSFGNIVTSNTQQGIHRKFLSNIIDSVTNISTSTSNLTPADGILQAGFIIPQIMGVTKKYDGDPQTPRQRSTTPPPGGLSEQQVWEVLTAPPTLSGINSVTGGGTLARALAWGDPGTTWGGPNNDGVGTFYDVFAPTSTSTAQTVGDLRIPISVRTRLIGDFNNDGVRDIEDTAAVALAYASPSTYLATTTSGARPYNGVAVLATGVTASQPGQRLGAPSANGIEGLIVLSDFNSDGNVGGQIGDTGVFSISPIDRADVKYFLWGATVDTRVHATLPAVTFTTPEARREDGVRFGQLKKNAAIDLFNLTLDRLVDGTGAGDGEADLPGFTQLQADTLKFEKRDVDGSGSTALGANPEFNFLVDAFAIDQFGGKRYTVLQDQAGSTLRQPYTINGNRVFIELNFDLVNAELNDSVDGLIDQADMNVMAQALRSTPGVNPSGRVDHVWATTNVKPGSLVIPIEADAGTFTVPNGGTLTINAGGIAAGGSVDPFSNGSNRLNIINNSMGVGGVGGLAVTAGTKTVGAIAGTGRTTVSGGTLVVNPGTSATPVVALQQAEVAVGGGTLRLAAGTNSVAIVDTLSVSGGGFFDVTDNSLIVRSTSGGYAAEIAAVRALVGSWYSGAAGLPGTTGLGSSLAFYPAEGAFTTLAVYDNSGLPTGGSVTFLTFAGQAVSATDILVKYTYLGDTNLDGVVDASDLSRVLQGINGGGTGWNFGDVNYDGVIDFADLGRTLAALRGQGAPLGGAAGGPGAAIPEPAAMGVLLAAVPLMGRRRR